MIKASDLRLGNWVDAGGMARALEIYPNSITTETAQNIWEFFPIPLTPEILEKCGFVKRGDWLYKEQFIIGFITTDNHFQTEYKMAGVEGNWKLLDIPYLHQLQNLFYSLTGKELNFQP